MILQLAALPSSLRGPDDADYKGRMPGRARYLAPDAADALLALEQYTTGLTYTDIFRSAEASLAACRSKRGVQRPGYSAHGYGLAVDLDVGATLRRLGIRYPELCEVMAKFHYHCHRRDLDGSGLECWHFNFLTDRAPLYLALASRGDHRTWSRPIEEIILDRYGRDFKLDMEQIQGALADQHFYHGAVDGKDGPLTREAVAAFKRAWCLEQETGTGPVFQRTLAYVTAKFQLVEPGRPTV